ncbi:glycoside hydrolase family 3 N-terminal domain-containing protein [Fibrobacter sp. HC4]|uniref:glycoside hydrolase family 3 N-terminal domain-containing protein n=1 Tax=Fibrobacter sp. HC4 TaxID=3239812 RepID=UPI002018F350|nr:glycoside hydrolase family 3 N-terminal domain-containing protein [Fibrobacter succinogenes]MCL4101095.1 Beta-glucosidase BoGH3B [Fibrobacter succinogenes]
MKKNRLLSAAITLFLSTAANAAVQGSVFDESGAPIKDAVVSIKTLPNLLPDARTLSNAKGKFAIKDKVADPQVLIVRKTGFLPETLSVAAVVDPKNPAKIILKRDPIEDQIDSLMSGMTIDDMIAQMTQAMVPNVKCGNSICGSALQGGGAYAAEFYKNAWAQKIPVTYGKDCVHGAADLINGTVYPHNIGLGATRDSALVRRIGQATAEEMWAAHIDYNFAPALSVPQDERWGRTYEGFGEKPELAIELGSAYLRGLQGDHFDAEWRVTGTIKHFIGDGGTAKGWDRGDVKATDAQIRKTHLPPYIAAVEQGAQSVMASFNTVRGVHQHVDSLRLTGWLKTELGFDGFVVADWEGIQHSTTPGNAGDYSGKKTSVSSEEAIRRAVNAGIDLAMVPSSAESFVSTLTELVKNKKVSEDRIKDAVRRILRVKIRAGRLENPNGPAMYVGVVENIGSAEHRAIAREAVQKSLVVLKNEGILPLAKDGKIFVTGSHADHTGLQSGAWTLGWQGTRGEVPGATSILAGVDQVAKGARVESADSANTVLYVIGESPYAEWFGDFREKDFNNKLFTTERSHTTHFESTDVNLKEIKAWKAAGKKVILVLVAGRPLPITKLIDAADGFVMAWLPGSEGAGVADVLFGDVKPSGKLPHTWPKDAKQIPINDGDGKKGLFPYGFGLTY